MRVDQTFYYQGGNNLPAFCRIRIYDNPKEPDGIILVASEMEDNPGLSITNAAEQVATQACRFYSLNVTDVTWIEHYEGDPLLPEQDIMGEHYDLVQFNINAREFSSPRWQRISKKALIKMVGEDL